MTYIPSQVAGLFMFTKMLHESGFGHKTVIGIVDPSRRQLVFNGHQVYEFKGGYSTPNHGGPLRWEKVADQGYWWELVTDKGCILCGGTPTNEGDDTAKLVRFGPAEEYYEVRVGRIWPSGSLQDYYADNPPKYARRLPV